MSPNWDVFFPTLNLGQNFIRQQKVWMDRWKRREYVYLINVGKREGAAGGKVRRGSGGRGRGEHVEQCQNHRHICCSSQMFPISFKCFLQSWESVQRAAKTEGGLGCDFLCVCVEEIGGLSPFFFFSLDVSINYTNFIEMHRSTKARVHISTGARSKANKWLLMCSVSQTEKQMPSTHESTQLLQASVDSYLYRN